MRLKPLLMLALVFASLHQARADPLYAARTIVTGTDARSRGEGLARTLAQVLAKVSGNPALLDDPRLAALDPRSLAQAFAYLDRMSDQPKRDEQGTRDRPYDLLVRFDPAAIDTALRTLGNTPWPLPRPPVAAVIAITPRHGPTLALQADTEMDERHRAALLEAADGTGLELILPAALAPIPAPPTAPRLSGNVAWSDPDTGWNAEWRLQWSGQAHTWTIKGVSFDQAYRAGMAGAAAALSGHTRQPETPR